MALSQSQEHSAITNGSYKLKSVVQIASFHNSIGQDVLLMLDDEGHNLLVTGERESYPGQHERQAAKRYRCAWCPKSA